MKQLNDYTKNLKRPGWLWRYAMVLIAVVFWGFNAYSQTFTNIDQASNGKYTSTGGTGTVEWQNGNLNKNNSHFLETYSIPYRVRIEGLTPGQKYTYIIGYDIRVGDKMALDFLTYFQRLTPHNQFGHAAETVNPLQGLDDTFLSNMVGGTDEEPIPVPNNYLQINGHMQPKDYAATQDRRMTLYGGTIQAVGYDAEGSLTESASESRIYVTFTPGGTTAVLAWGANIAGDVYWGSNMTAKDISGSPYHMRHRGYKLGDWSAWANGGYTSLGNTDRSLKTDAIIQPPTCTLNSTTASVCVGGSASFTVTASGGAGGPYTYSWTGPNGFTASSATITINNAQLSNAGTYTATVTDKIGLTSTGCPAVLTVNANPTADAGADPAAQCYSESGNTFSLNGSGSNGTAKWTVLTNTSNLTVGFDNDESFTPQVTVSGGTGSVTLRLTVTSNTTPSCGTDTDDVTVTVNENPELDYDITEPSLCGSSHAIITVESSTVKAGNIYTLTSGLKADDSPYSRSIEATSDGQSIVFQYIEGTDVASFLAAGSGFTLEVVTEDDCTVQAATCPVEGVQPIIGATSTNSLQTIEQPKPADDQLTAYPIPFSERTTLEFKAEQSGKYEINLYDMKGQLIRQLKSGTAKAGEVTQIEVDGRSMADGMYLARMVSGSGAKTVKLLKKNK